MILPSQLKVINMNEPISQKCDYCFVTTLMIQQSVGVSNFNSFGLICVDSILHANANMTLTIFSKRFPISSGFIGSSSIPWIVNRKKFNVLKKKTILKRNEQRQETTKCNRNIHIPNLDAPPFPLQGCPPNCKPPMPWSSKQRHKLIGKRLTAKSPNKCKTHFFLSLLTDV